MSSRASCAARPVPGSPCSLCALRTREDDPPESSNRPGLRQTRKIPGGDLPTPNADRASRLSPYLTLLIGLLCAGLGGELFVRGVVELAGWARVFTAIIATIVAAFDTSSPELSVATGAAVAGRKFRWATRWAAMSSTWR